MADNTITLVSMNCQGLSNKTARADTLNFLKSKNYSIYMLQDTHFINKEEKYIRAQWGYECYFSNFTSQSRGVAILFNNNFEFKVHNIEKDNEGNKLILDIAIKDKRLLLIDIYGPNRDTPEFYLNILKDIEKYDYPVILAGDFNLILNPGKDSCDYIQINNPKAREQVLNLMIECNLVDVWREMNIEKNQYTWRRKNTNKKSRLDFFLISESLFVDVQETKIQTGYKTDHSLVLLKFDFDKFKKGKSYWKFNNSLLKDQIYVREIKKIISDTKAMYASEFQTYNNTDINTILLEDLILKIDDQLFYDVLLMEIRGKTISYASFKKKSDENRECKLLEEIDQLEKQDVIQEDLLDNRKKELFELRQKKMEGKLIRSRAKWIDDGEKVTKYFCNLENRNFISKCMNTLINDTGTTLKDQSDILNETMTFYKHLYSKKFVRNIDLKELLRDSTVPKLTENDKNVLEGIITYDELLKCLKKASNNTSPGFDGFTYEFFKFFWADLGGFMLRAINASFIKGEFSETFKRGVITCIPKGNKDKQFLKNWRPISLLNTSYKLTSACIAERLKTVLSKLINEDQTGFISGRFIGENIRLLYDVINYTEKQEIPGMLLLIDFEKAFDSVSWEFLFTVLDFFEFGNSFVKWVQVFYKNIQSCVVVNGHLSDWFFLERGCRQGDPLSPYLFILCAEILAILIRNNDNIKGIRIGESNIIISQYADDTSIILDGSKKSLKTCLKVLQFYAEASGLCINVEKTNVIWIGSKKNSNEKFCEEYNLSWNNNEYTILGVKFTKNLETITETNFITKIEEMKRVFSNWSKRILTPIGRIVVIKSLALSKINHLILSLPDPPERLIKDIQNMFYNYLWAHGPDKIKRKIIIQDYDMGGLRMTDVNLFIKSLKLTWLRRIMVNSSRYYATVKELYPEIGECSKFGSKIFDVKKHRISNKFWKDVLFSYKLFSESVKPANWSEFLRMPIWCNNCIKVGGSTVLYQNWVDQGILFINDLLDRNGDIISYEIFQRTYQIRTNFLQFEGIVASIRDFLQNCRFQHLPVRAEEPFIPLVLKYISKDKKGCRAIYDKFTSNTCTPAAVAKWHNDLNLPLDFDWKKTFGLPFRVTNDTGLKWFQYRINHRILGTNYLLSKMNLKDNDRCSFCQNHRETIKHLFWECDNVVQFWEDFRSLLQEKCGLQDLLFSETDIIFGNMLFEAGLNNLLLWGKQFIYRMKCEGKIPTLAPFKRLIISHFKIEKYRSVKNQTQASFRKKWLKYLNITSS